MRAMTEEAKTRQTNATLGLTTSACGICRALVPAKVMTDGNDVCFRKFCPSHGEHESFVRRDLADYLRTLRYVKPAWQPAVFNGHRGAGCPDDCGFCEHHEQHLCMPLLEITNRCNLACPCCLNSSGSTSGDSADLWEMTRDEFGSILGGLLRAERQIDVLTLSGGEPLLHPDLLVLLDDALSRKEIVRVSISTNGLGLLPDPRLLSELRARDIVISLQMDGFNDKAYRTLRGRPLLGEKLEILARLKEADITTSLTMTAAAGVNDDQFPEMLKLLFGEKHIVSLMIQPMAFAGRGAEMAGKFPRLTIPEVVQRLGEAGHRGVNAEDFVPLPCSHPLCFSLAFYLAPAGGAPVSLNRLTNAATMLDCLSNRVFFGLNADEHQKLKQLVYDLWSGPSALTPDSQAVLRSLRTILRSISDAPDGAGFDPRKVFTAAERSVKSIFIHAFQDADTFDLSRVRRCCQAYPQRDGSLIPACVRNVLKPQHDGPELRRSEHG